MDAPEQVPDAELLYVLRMDYAQALQQEDYGRINRVIVPRFLERFGKYYEEYARDWKSLSLSRLPVRVVIDPRQREEMQIEWADRVLKGQIDLNV
jgi:hypothetical protein